MYKITTVGPGNEKQIPDELDELSTFEVKSATAMIITAQEDDDAIKLIITICEMIASGQATSITVTKDDSDDNKTDC